MTLFDARRLNNPFNGADKSIFDLAHMISGTATEFVFATKYSAGARGLSHVTATGSNFAYDDHGHVTGGKITGIQIEFQPSDNFGGPSVIDFTLSSLTAKATDLIAGTFSFWRAVLGGDDVIQIGDRTYSNISGDIQNFNASVPVRQLVAGDDIITHHGLNRRPSQHDVPWFVAGDCGELSGATGVVTVLHGGDDRIRMLAFANNAVAGDVYQVKAGGALIGGDDTITIATKANSPLFEVLGVVGDAYDNAGVTRAGNDLIVQTGPYDDATYYLGDCAFSSNKLIAGDDTIRGIGEMSGDVRYNSGELHAGDDLITGGAATSFLTGDVIEAGGRVFAGADTINAGRGNDFIVGDAGGYGFLDYHFVIGVIKFGADLLRGGEGNDWIVGDSAYEHGYAAAPSASGNDSIYGDGGNDRLIGDFDSYDPNGRPRLRPGGNDQISGGNGSDTISGDYNGTLSGEALQITLNGGDDRIFGDAGNDYLCGDSAFTEGFGGQQLFVNEGDDSISGGTGNDTIFGGADGVANGGIVTVLAYGHDTLDGGDGNDSIEAGRGDLIFGGSGDDRIVSNSTHENTINGGLGSDLIDYSRLDSGVNLTLDQGHGPGSAVFANGRDTLTGIENVVATPFDDTLVGNAAANSLKGQNGDDVIYGGGGADTLEGGFGYDVYFYGNLTDSGIVAGSRDVVINPRSLCLFDFTSIDANTEKSGLQHLKFVNQGPVGAGEIGVEKIDHHFFIEVNVDSDAAPEMTIALQGMVELSKENFLL